MEHLLLPAWRGRRVLLAGDDGGMSRAMHALLIRIGARPAQIPICSDNEAYCRALMAGRGTLLIAPDMNALAAQPPARWLTAIQAMLCEARESGTPLTMLIARREDVSTAQGQALAHLAVQAQSAACAHRHDALSFQWIWHETTAGQDACIRALALGARYLMGDHTRLGFLSAETTNTSNERTHFRTI